MIFVGFAVLLSVCTILSTFRVVHRNMIDSQTAKAVRADKDALFEIFERLEAFFRRLEIYTELSLDQNMVEMVIQIMVEVLSIIGIATKDLKQGRISMSSVQRSSSLTEPFSEKYLKRLYGNSRTDIEDALKRLDILTQEESRMAMAQNLKVTHAVDSKVMRVEDIVLSVDNRVTSIDERVAGVDERVAGVDNRVASIDVQLQGVDYEVAAVMDGTQYLLSIIVKLSNP